MKNKLHNQYFNEVNGTSYCILLNIFLQSTFESLAEEFHEEVSDELQAAYWAYMKKLSVEKLSHLLEVLHEYILLVVAVRQNPSDEDYIPTFDNKYEVFVFCV